MSAVCRHFPAGLVPAQEQWFPLDGDYLVSVSYLDNAYLETGAPDWTARVRVYPKDTRTLLLDAILDAEGVVTLGGQLLGFGPAPALEVLDAALSLMYPPERVRGITDATLAPWLAVAS
jgi:hypothetical protein